MAANASTPQNTPDSKDWEEGDIPDFTYSDRNTTIGVTLELGNRDDQGVFVPTYRAHRVHGPKATGQAMQAIADELGVTATALKSAFRNALWALEKGDLASEARVPNNVTITSE